MSDKFILAIDQGTSSTKTVIFDSQGEIVSKANEPLKSLFPKPGFVEQDPLEIYQNVLISLKKCLAEFTEESSRKLNDIACCGISNQRETFVLWDASGQPVSNAIVWQCKRSIDICNRLKESEFENEVKKRTGLIIDPYFSGTKLIWLYENNLQIRNAIDHGQTYFGTIDTWLLFKLTNGRRFLTDYTNACRTLFFNIDGLQWDKYLLDKFNLQNLLLPQPQPSSYSFGKTDFDGLLPNKVNISAMIGDSHAAAFGEGCFSGGTAKATMGTGSSILLNTGQQRIQSNQGMVSTICWSIPGRVDYALEGIIVTCGATINWLRDQLGLFSDSKNTQEMSLSVKDNNGVYFIPAFSGLGAPHWKMNAKALILGLTLDCNKNHIIRAALESIPYQIKDVITAMEQDSGIKLKELKADGGITSNHFIMQFLSDLLGTDVINIGIEEVSALGAAYMAGLQKGIFTDISQIQKLNQNINRFSPNTNNNSIMTSYKGWKNSIEQHL